MAGAKGRSGGPRANSGGARANSGGARANSGGARPGAGRPPKEPEYLNLSSIYDDPATFLKAVMNDSGSDAKLRVDAAKALLRERAEAGKKRIEARGGQESSRREICRICAP